ncbi:MAG TPA: hypothetical protein VHK01_20140 [Lacipirellulaceae bacterium]|nr:hypothetical protein [Lacipirellulaceae bacterium]
MAKSTESASAQLAAATFAEINASGSISSKSVTPAVLQDGEPNQAVALRESFAESIARRAPDHSFLKPAIRPSVGSEPELADQHYDDGLLAWVAQLDEKRNTNNSNEACMIESKAARRTDDFTNDGQNNMIGQLTSFHRATFRTL